MTRTYTVYYTRTTNGDIDIEATSADEAQRIVEGYCGSDFGGAREYDDPVDIYDVEEKE